MNIGARVCQGEGMDGLPQLCGAEMVCKNPESAKQSISLTLYSTKNPCCPAVVGGRQPISVTESNSKKNYLPPSFGVPWRGGIIQAGQTGMKRTRHTF